jgi:2-polyprenyl-6-methoxyphenol hydroxylase-like FAD-dependent oxidoreductase
MELAYLSRQEYDVAIIGAGPVGLAMAIELSRLGLTTLVVDRRPPVSEDAKARPQLLVARAGDLAHLAHLGVALDDPTIVSLLATRCERDLASGRSDVGDVRAPRGVPSRTQDLAVLSAQPPLALVPIARLQRALLDRAVHHGADVQYGCDVTRLRRHAQGVSLVCADGTTARAAMAIIATGAARPLISAIARDLAPVEAPAQQLIAGVFAIGGDRGRWVRVELPLAAFVRPVRCTLLQTPVESEAGTALLVDTQIAGNPTHAWLRRCFDGVAHALDLAGAPFLVEPQVFTTAVTAMPRHFIAGDGRAPVVIAGDAAQTGHVFSGQTCFVNVALALGLCEQLRRARAPLVDRKVNAPALLAALAHYSAESDFGAGILARASHRHQTQHAPGAWALAGIARA